MDDVVDSGRYDDQAKKILEDHVADMVLLMVINGQKGHGMSVCINANRSQEQAREMANGTPELLRRMADMIEHTGKFEKSESKPKSWSDLAAGEEEQH